jgi:hypothetical protein
MYRGATTLFLFIAVPTLALTLASCGTVEGVVGSVRNDAINQLQVGMTKEQVWGIMGTPSRREAYGNREFLIYMTARNPFSEKLMVPIAIENDRVTGWGMDYYRHIIRQEVDVKIR